MAKTRTSTNPFATRFVAPGQLAWVSPDSETDVDQLRHRLAEMNFRAALVGPHGSGKSTLLEHLLRPLGPAFIRRDHSGHIVEQSEMKADNPGVWLVLRRGTKVDLCRSAWRRGAILVLDGFEQLSYLGRLRVILATRSKQMGLVVTSHRPVWLPTLLRTAVTPAVMKRIVDQAAADAGVDSNAMASVNPTKLERLLHTHRGNAREVMMQLYDEFAQVQAATNARDLRGKIAINNSSFST